MSVQNKPIAPQLETEDLDVETITNEAVKRAVARVRKEAAETELPAAHYTHHTSHSVHSNGW